MTEGTATPWPSSPRRLLRLPMIVTIAEVQRQREGLTLSSTAPALPLPPRHGLTQVSKPQAPAPQKAAVYGDESLKR